MGLLKVSIRIWFGLISLLGFVGGWILFAHSGKPAQAAQAPANQPSLAAPAAIPTLVPMGSTGSSSSSQIQPLPQVQQPSFSFFPQMRTRGS